MCAGLTSALASSEPAPRGSSTAGGGERRAAEDRGARAGSGNGRAAEGPGSALCAEVRVLLRFHALENLDLLTQGWYAVRGRCFAESSRVAGVPVAPAPPAAKPGHRDARAEPATASYRTRAGSVVFTRQHLALGEQAEFQLLAPADGLEREAVVVELELLYAKFKPGDGPATASVDGVVHGEPSAALEPVARHRFRLPGALAEGRHAHLPALFDELHLARVDVTAHVAVVGFSPAPPARRRSASKFLLPLGGSSRSSSPSPSPPSPPQPARDSELASPAGLPPHVASGPADAGAPDSDLLAPMLAPDGGTVVSGELAARWHDRLVGSLHASRAHIAAATRLLEPNGEALAAAVLAAHAAGTDGTGASARFAVEASALTPWQAGALLSTLCASAAGSAAERWASFVAAASGPTSLALVRALERDVEDLRRSSAQWVRGSVRVIAVNPDAVPLQGASTPREGIAELRQRLKAQHQTRVSTEPVEDLRMWESPWHQPILTTVEYSPRLSGEGLAVVARERSGSDVLLLDGLEADGGHVYVFVHGFQGQATDLRLVRDHLREMHPGVVCLMSEANVGQTFDDFRSMGRRLAEEVAAFITSTYAGSNAQLRRLSFVGHSIGNVIVRAALTEDVLARYLPNLYTFLSIAGPHLGYGHASNTLMEGGVWVLKKLVGSGALHQLTLADAPCISDCFLYKLSESSDLGMFRNVVLVASKQDRYAPYPSASVAVVPKGPTKAADAAEGMVRNLLGRLQDRVASGSARFMRVDVDFYHNKYRPSIDKLVGRTAHIEFLETDVYIRLLLWHYSELL